MVGDLTDLPYPYTSTGMLFCKLSQHYGIPLTSITFALEGKLIAFVKGNNEIIVLQRNEILELPSDATLEARIKGLNTKTINLQKTDSPVTRIVFGSATDQKCVLWVAYNDGEIAVKSLDGESLFIHKLEGTITALDFCSTTRSVLVGTASGAIHVIDATSYQLLGCIRCSPSPVTYLKTESSNQQLYAYCGDRAVVVRYEFSQERNTFKYEITQQILSHTKSTSKPLCPSEDGKLLCIVDFNKPSGLSGIVLRHREALSEEYKVWCSLVGRSFECEMVDVCPNVFLNSAKSESRASPVDCQNYYIVATVGSTGTLAIWNTAKGEPIVLIKELTDSKVADLCWDPQGLILFVTSLDGNLFILRFDKAELGALRTHVSENPVKPLKEGADVVTLGPAIVFSSSKKGTEEKLVTKGVEKKRVEPVLISNGKQENSKKEPNPTKRSASTMEMDGPLTVVSGDVNALAQESLAVDEPTKRPRQVFEPVEFVGSVVLNPSTAFSNVRLSTPKVRSHFTFNSLVNDNLRLDIKNGSGGEASPSKVTLFKTSYLNAEAEKVVFSDFIPKQILIATGGDGLFWAVGLTDGTILVYNDSGRRILPALTLGSPLSFLESKGKYLMAVTNLGELYVWNLDTKRIFFPSTSLYPLLKSSAKALKGGGELFGKSENLTLCSITDLGMPIVTLANGQGYLYNIEMESWCVISDSWWAVGSQYWDSTSLSAPGVKGNGDGNGILALLEKNTNEEILRRGKGQLFNKLGRMMLMKEGFESVETIISLNHLENKLLVLEILQDGATFKTTMIKYCRKLSELGLKTRLLEVFAELLGPQEGMAKEKDVNYAYTFGMNWDSAVCGLKKHELLTEILLSCCKFREVQRLVIQYAEPLGIIDKLDY